MAGTQVLTDAKRRLLEELKRAAPAPARALAQQLGLTDTAVRQHLAALAGAGLVTSSPVPAEGRGRPAAEWSLTDAARELFPDRHAQLSLELIEAIRAANGEAGLRRVIDARAQAQVIAYQRVVPGTPAPLRRRVDALARQRTREGYMAEVRREGPGSFLLVEHHCPVCEAARSCTGLCRTEWRTFQQVLGEDVVVERTEHLLSGDERCVYRVRAVHPTAVIA